MVGMHGSTRCEIWHRVMRHPRKRDEEETIDSRPARRAIFVGLFTWRKHRPERGIPACQRIDRVARGFVSRPSCCCSTSRPRIERHESRRSCRPQSHIKAAGVTISVGRTSHGSRMPTAIASRCLNYGQAPRRRQAGRNPSSSDVIKAYLWRHINGAHDGCRQVAEAAHDSLEKRSAAYGPLTAPFNVSIGRQSRGIVALIGLQIGSRKVRHVEVISADQGRPAGRIESGRGP